MKKEKNPAPAATGAKGLEKTSTNSIIQGTEQKSNRKPDVKSRVWWGVIYLDSAPSDWKEKCQSLFLETYISPYHCDDIDIGTGKQKKPHYHVVLIWSGPTTYSNAKKSFESFGAVMQPTPVGTVRAVCRYLCHLDNPDKAQYKKEDVITFNGGDYETVINLISEKYDTVKEMQDWCDKYAIYSFTTLCRYARNSRTDWWRALCDNCGYIMREYCKSTKWELDANGCIASAEDLDEYIAAVDAHLAEEATTNGKIE